jgi:hypothetical protein
MDCIWSCQKYEYSDYSLLESLSGSSPLCAKYNISIDKVGKAKHNKTLLRYRSQKKDNMFRPFYYKAIIMSDMEN